jgi:hypothetical protein
LEQHTTNGTNYGRERREVSDFIARFVSLFVPFVFPLGVLVFHGRPG